MPRILTVTLNPAIDITTAVAAVEPGRKLRCEAARFDPGGGGVNASRVIKELGGLSTALVAVGGTTGVLMRRLLDDAGIATVYLNAAGMTREDFAVHDRATGVQYRFLLPGPVQDAAFGERALGACRELLAAGDFPYVVASGSLPPGLPEDFYASLAGVVREHGARMILDTSGPALQASLSGSVFLIRTNDREASELAETLNADPDDPESLARSMVASGNAEIVIITLGASGALLVSKQGVVRIRSPSVDVVSPVGGGDSFVGALSFALAEGWSIERACGYGIAAAAAAMTTEATELAHTDDIARLFAEIEEHIPWMEKAGER